MKVNGQLKSAQVEAVTNEAARPAAGQEGRILYDIALAQLIYDNGSAWEVLQTETSAYKKTETYNNTEVYSKAESDASLSTKYQRKALGANQDVEVTGMSSTEPDSYITDLAFNNLEEGTYRVTYNVYLALDWATSAPTNYEEDIGYAHRLQLSKSGESTITINQADYTERLFMDSNASNNELDLEYKMFTLSEVFTVDADHDGGELRLYIGEAWGTSASHVSWIVKVLCRDETGVSLDWDSSAVLEKLPNHTATTDWN